MARRSCAESSLTCESVLLSACRHLLFPTLLQQHVLRRDDALELDLVLRQAVYVAESEAQIITQRNGLLILRARTALLRRIVELLALLRNDCLQPTLPHR